MSTDLLDKPKAKQTNDQPNNDKQNGTQKDKGNEDTTKLALEELYYKTKDDISKKLSDNIRALEERVGLHTSFDVIIREMTFGSKNTFFFYLNGFAKDTVLTEIMKRLSFLKKEDIHPNTLKSFFSEFIPHIQVEIVQTMHEVVDKVLAGSSAMFIESEESAIVIDAKTFPVRSIDEPVLERVVRGSRDGFVETLLTNVTLVRRRIRDPRLKAEVVQVGTRTKTDICIAYINDIADLQLVESIRDKIAKVKIDGLPLGEKQLEEIMINKGWNPYPMVRYSERPDVVANHLLEGHVVIFVDTSPSVMILPTTFFHHMQHAEEYRQVPFIGTYLRWVRFLGIFSSLFLLPLWFLFVLKPDLLPPALEFIGPKETGNIPIILQFLIIELGIDLMRMAAIHTPSPLTVSMGLVSAILLGDIAVKSGLFISEVILYMAIAGIGMFATPSYEMSLANRITRLVLLIAVAAFKIPGLVVGTTLVLLFLVVQRSYNTSYMWPFIPFNARALMFIVLRKPTLSMKMRPSITKTLDNTRMPNKK